MNASKGRRGGGRARGGDAGRWEISTEVTGRRIGTGASNNSTGCVAGSGSAPAPGRIQANVQCEMPGGGRVQVTTEGSTSADRLTATQTTVVSFQGTTMTRRARVTGTRVGDCPG